MFIKRNNFLYNIYLWRDLQFVYVLPGRKRASNADRSNNTEHSDVSRAEAKRASARARYANMTPEQRQARRDRQNARNAMICNSLDSASLEARRSN